MTIDPLGCRSIEPTEFVQLGGHDLPKRAYQTWMEHELS